MIFLEDIMARLFCEHIKREVTCLDGAWRAVTDASDVGMDTGYQKGLKNWRTVIIPSVWNTEMGMLEYEGVVWYEKEFYTKGGTLRFSFDAVMTEAKVYLDGELLGEHYGGFCSFHFTKPSVSEGIHRLTVRVDNRFDKRSIPQATVDWYHYGGITRSVRVERLSGISVLYSFLDYKLNEDNADCTLRAELFNSEKSETSDEVAAYIDGKRVAEERVTLKAYESKEISLSFTLCGVKRWSINNPRLYELLTVSSSDDLYERVGFRSIEIKDKRILLNGDNLTLLGVNRHEEHPDFGMAFPKALMLRDVEIIENMNCNSIRGSHYPNDKIFIDMLDERGITFWSEVPMWGPGYGADCFSDPVFVKRAMDMHKEMIREYYNHPSIIIWGIFNETDTSAEATKEFAKNCYRMLKKEGGGRPVTFATNQLHNDVCLDYCDFISINLYVGWYDQTDERYSTWESAMNTLESYFDSVKVGDKPIVMSEFGAAAIYGHHTFDNLKWTEEYQANLIGACLDLFLNRKGYAGTYVWQFSDIRTSKEMGLNRARSFNNKGLVNEYRKPKAAYFTVKDFYKNHR